MTTIGSELKKCRRQSRMTLSEVATRLNVSTTTVVNYETGKRMPDVDFLIGFAEISGSDLIYWLGLRVEASSSAGAAAAKALLEAAGAARGSAAVQSGQSFVSLPLYDIGVKDVISADTVSGHGRDTDEILQFNVSWIERELNATPSDLYMILVDDESMEPTLRPGDMALLDRRATKPDREGVYLLKMNGASLVKRLQILPGGIVKVVSDNPAYESFSIGLADINDRDLAILGRVVWVVWAGRRI